MCQAGCEPALTCVQVPFPKREGLPALGVCGRGLRVDPKMCVCLSVHDHMWLKGLADVTWVPICAPRLCAVLCVWVYMWVAECVYRQTQEQGSK